MIKSFLKFYKYGESISKISSASFSPNPLLIFILPNPLLKSISSISPNPLSFLSILFKDLTNFISGYEILETIN